MVTERGYTPVLCMLLLSGHLYGSSFSKSLAHKDKSQWFSHMPSLGWPGYIHDCPSLFLFEAADCIVIVDELNKINLLFKLFPSYGETSVVANQLAPVFTV